MICATISKEGDSQANVKESVMMASVSIENVIQVNTPLPAPAHLLVIIKHEITLTVWRDDEILQSEEILQP